MRILVTGHKGFIGQHLVAELESAGHVVIGHDRAEGDLTEFGVFRDALALARPDYVIHLAAQVGRLFGEQDLAYTISENALMTAFVAKACGELGTPVLYASTSEVYGDRGDEPSAEDGPMMLPHNLYGLSKRWGEEVLRLYSPSVKIVRLSMPYGPGAPPGRGRRALDTFLWQAHHRMPITVHRGAERSWCWVGDTVCGIRIVLERGAAGAYNVGRDDCPVSMIELAELACLMTGAPFGLITVVDPPANQTVVKRLPTKWLRALGWQPTVELEDGMVRVLEWVREFDPDGNRIERIAA